MYSNNIFASLQYKGKQDAIIRILQYFPTDFLNENVVFRVKAIIFNVGMCGWFTIHAF